MKQVIKEGEEVCPRLLVVRKADFQSDNASSILVEGTNN